MKRHEKDGVVFYVFEHIERTGLARHGFSTKLGGVSEGVYATMNLSGTRGDDVAHVHENIRRMACAMGMYHGQTVFCEQVHGTRVAVATPMLYNEGTVHPEGVRATDGLIADTSDVVLATIHADCVPLFFLDTVRKAVGMTHAGWRGTLGDIAGETVRRMQAEFGSNPSDVLVGIGPSIGPCCFEVGADVAAEFAAAMPYATDCIQPSATDAGKAYMDLQRVNELLLLRAGVRAENIETAGLCTKCHDELFYSHRRDGQARGSMAVFMQLNCGRDR